MMKTLLFTLLFPLITQAAFIGDTVQVMDGSSASCTKKSDLFTHKRGAYQLDVSAPVIKGDWLVFNLKAKFMACQKKGESFGFMTLPAFAPLKYDLDGNEVIIHTRDVFMTVSRDDMPFMQIAWGPASNIIAVGIDSVLDENEKERFLNGEEVSASLDFSIEKDLEFVAKNGFTSGERAHFGSFRRHFKLKL
jgi:hypothetical protein